MYQANIELQSFTSSKNRADHILTKLYPPETSMSEVVTSFQAVRDQHVDGALKCLTEFPTNDATHALGNIARALKF